ncbi:MAG: HDOD domain-containing protein [Desulfobacteraceae bacterium]|nr:HDOD domain-containing protein [Desulfobacteraceae bacterium]
MPSLSTTVSKVLQICNDPAASPNDLNRVISLDPVLTGRMLKLINSAYYGLPVRITSLVRAIIMLGINTVKNLVLATSIVGSFKSSGGLKGQLIEEFWEHCLRVAVAGKILASHLGVPVQEREEYFLAGLLHDLGKLPIMACYTELYQTVLGACVNSIEKERQVFGFDHCHINRLIITKWKLNQQIGSAIINHHTPFEGDCEPVRLVLCTSMANIAIHYFSDCSDDNQVAKENLLKILKNYGKLDLADITELQSPIAEQLEKAKVFLNLTGKGK